MSHEGLADTSTSHCVADLTFSKQQEEEVKGSSRLEQTGHTCLYSSYYASTAADLLYSK